MATTAATARRVAVSLVARDPVRIGRFWADLVDQEIIEDPQGPVLAPADDTGFRIRFRSSEEPKTGPNRMHFDLTSTSLQNQQQTVDRALELGARHIDVGQRPEQEHVVLADPEGNEFCVIEPGNHFLSDCGFIGALACDGSQAVGYFWSAALGWPLVWDQDEETAIRSPHGGPKISWGGPPVSPKTGRNRISLEVDAPVHSDQRTEIERLVALGASPNAIRPGTVDRVELTDPDGNEFWLSTSP